MVYLCRSVRLLLPAWFLRTAEPAISIIFTGLTVATVTGVPLGTFIGQQLGWRLAFVAIVVVGIVALIASSILVPSDLPKGERNLFREQAKLLTNGRMLLMLLITALGYGGTFVVFTYLSPLLQDITGFKEKYGSHHPPCILDCHCGRQCNRREGSQSQPLRALLYMFIFQALVLFALTFTAPFKVAGLITIILMGFLVFMKVSGLQVYVVMLAERFVSGAVNMASALNIAAFNAGIATALFWEV